MDDKNKQNDNKPGDQSTAQPENVIKPDNNQADEPTKVEVVSADDNDSADETPDTTSSEEKDSDETPTDNVVTPESETEESSTEADKAETSSSDEPAEEPAVAEEPTKEEEPTKTEEPAKTEEQPLSAVSSSNDSYEQFNSSLEEQPSEQPVPAAAVSSSSTSSGRKKFGGKGWLKLGLPIAIVVAVLLAAAVYALAFYLPSRPANVYESSLSNTGKALDELIAYSEEQQEVKYQSVNFDGSLKYSGLMVAEADLNGVIGQNGNSRAEVNINYMGSKFKGELLFNKLEGNNSPDVYFKVNGIKQIFSGSKELAKLDGQWLVVDHTLVESLKNRAESTAGVEAQSQTDAAPTMAQINDATTKLQAVNKKYIFTTDPKNAVLKKQKFVGEETVNGRSVYHYKVTYNKDNLKAYVDAVGKALDSSQLNDWAKKTYDKNISQMLDIEDAKKQIDEAKDGYNFDLWADKQTKLVQSVKFTSKDKKSTVTISQNYTGGDTFPMSIKINGENGDKSQGSATFGVTVNTDTNKIIFDMSSDNLGSKDQTLSGKFSLTPSNEPVEITVPKQSTSINKVLQQFPLFSGTSLTAGN